MSTVLRIRGIRAGYAKANAMMTSLLTVKSSRVFYKLCGNIARKWPRLSDWVRHKKQRFIILGLTRACSPLSDEDWHTIGSNTNGAESRHQKAYTEGGQFVSLIEAVKRISGQYIDGNSSAKFYNYTKTGKRDRYRNTTAEGREDLSKKRYVRPGKRAKTVIEDAHERALDAQITVDEMKDEVQELRTAVPTQTAAHLAQSQLIANLNDSLRAANAEGDHEFRDQIKRRILEVMSTPAASISGEFKFRKQLTRWWMSRSSAGSSAGATAEIEAAGVDITSKILRLI
ncbi:hypothetical protein E4U13_006644 [Claviceps humidiphila]|uniref:Uncharacterized protein n=1 Tax=Claviceps humidiphila TaxID=1294629 RepID=A0A9P7PW90_9HYPO|nr:hypothetical protein E4U13_006644 [Claviceps humidiphila]